ncbi:MAG: hypothetical protein H6742_17340 [Alphaproteobacteria bacterium]|nr:hypothetical protein [Alphaproteobacteria bacterium]
MAPSAFLLGDPERLAFAGHLRLRHDGQRARLAVAGRVGVGEVEDTDARLRAAWAAASTLRAALRHGLQQAAPDADRHVLLRTLWESLLVAPAAAHGPTGGAETTLLAVVTDDEGVGVAAIGLCRAWALRAAGPEPLVEPGHPLLCAPGLPERTPGVLTLDAPDGVQAVLGAPSHLAPTLGPADGDGGLSDLPGAALARRFGIRP